MSFIQANTSCSMTRSSAQCSAQGVIAAIMHPPIDLLTRTDKSWFTPFADIASFKIILDLRTDFTSTGLDRGALLSMAVNRISLAMVTTLTTDESSQHFESPHIFWSYGQHGFMGATYMSLGNGKNITVSQDLEKNRVVMHIIAHHTWRLQRGRKNALLVQIDTSDWFWGIASLLKCNVAWRINTVTDHRGLPTPCAFECSARHMYEMTPDAINRQVNAQSGFQFQSLDTSSLKTPPHVASAVTMLPLPIASGEAKLGCTFFDMRGGPESSIHHLDRNVVLLPATLVWALFSEQWEFHLPSPGMGMFRLAHSIVSLEPSDSSFLVFGTCQDSPKLSTLCVIVTIPPDIREKIQTRMKVLFLDARHAMLSHGLTSSRQQNPFRDTLGHDIIMQVLHACHPGLGIILNFASTRVIQE
jgi:hypothetical protein